MAADQYRKKTEGFMGQELYETWIEGQLKGRKGEERRRLEEGHQYAEKLFATQIWLPAVGHFEHLYPEYALTDYRDKARFVDFAYIRPPYRICFEIDGYGPHIQQASRRSFADGLMRQNQLILDDWRVFRFSVDDLEQQARKCQQMILHILGKWYGGIEKKEEPLSPREAQIVQAIVAAGAPMTPRDVAELLGMDRPYISRLLKRISTKGYIRSIGNPNAKRMRAYIPTVKSR